MKKKLIIISVIILSVTLLIAARAMYIHFRFKPFIDITGVEGLRYEGKYECGVVLPAQFPKIPGNLYVTPIRHAQKNENGKLEIKKEPLCDLIIHVRFPSGYSIRAQVNDENGNGLDDIFLNENMELESDDGKEIYEKYYKEIRESFVVAHTVFGILNPPEE